LTHSRSCDQSGYESEPLHPPRQLNTLNTVLLSLPSPYPESPVLIILPLLLEIPQRLREATV